MFQVSVEETFRWARRFAISRKVRERARHNYACASRGRPAAGFDCFAVRLYGMKRVIREIIALNHQFINDWSPFEP